MTVGQMEELLAGILDKDMPIVIDTEDRGLVSVCGENSQVLKLKVVEDEDFDDGQDFEDDDPINDFHEYDLEEDEEEDEMEVLLLVPCNHVEDHLEEGELNSQPELN